MDMIPKIIYHIWISDKPCPEYFKQYTDTWSKIMPDYKIINITVHEAAMISHGHPILETLLSEKKWCLANHYMRYYLLYKQGGLYLDLDVEVVKPFDDLLGKKFIIGYEDPSWISNAVMGCTPNHPVMKSFIDMMDNFDYSQSEAELKTGVRLPTKILKEMDVLEYILPPVYFYPYLYTEKFTPECIKPETHAIHHWEASWTDKPKHNG